MKKQETNKRARTTPRFAQLLNSMMKEQKMGVRQASRCAGVSPSTIVSWRSGALPEDYFAVKKLAQALGTTLSYLLTGEDDSRPIGSTPTISEVFTEGELLLDGYAKITIQRMVPKKEK